MDFSDIKTILEQQGDAFAAFRASHESRLDALELKAARPSGTSAYSGSGFSRTARDHVIDVKSGRLVPLLQADESLAAIDGKGERKAPSVGRQLRGILLGSRAHDAAQLADEFKALGGNVDPSGGYTISGQLGAQWIDRLRAAMVLTRAGVRTLPMDARSVTMAKLTGDPTVAWHAENAALADSDPTFGAVTLNSKTVCGLVRMSLELSQDSANIETILEQALVASLAHGIDSAGLVGVTADAAAATPGIFNLSGRNTVTSIGAPTSWDFLADGMFELLADDVPAERIGAMVAHPALWKKMVKLKTGITNDNTPLSAPEELARVPKLWTTAAPLAGGTTAKAVLGDWGDYVFGIRRDITVRVLQEAFLGSNLQIGVLAYARVDFVATRAQSFCTLEGITV